MTSLTKIYTDAGYTPKVDTRTGTLCGVKQHGDGTFLVCCYELNLRTQAADLETAVALMAAEIYKRKL